METYKEECLAKGVTINKLQRAVGKLQSLLGERKNEVINARKERDAALEQLQPVKQSLERLTAEHGKVLRKLARKSNRR